MKKGSAFILLACIFGLLTTERGVAAPVTWDFEAVWIAQRLCPQRHCILARADEAENARAAEETPA
jgi:hypothetical protein